MKRPGQYALGMLETQVCLEATDHPSKAIAGTALGLDGYKSLDLLEPQFGERGGRPLVANKAQEPTQATPAGGNGLFGEALNLVEINSVTLQLGVAPCDRLRPNQNQAMYLLQESLCLPNRSSHRIMPARQLSPSALKMISPQILPAPNTTAVEVACKMPQMEQLCLNGSRSKALVMTPIGKLVNQGSKNGERAEELDQF
jgi:hypothetical protein